MWISRVLGNPDNPLGWSLPLFRVAGVRVRAHLFTLVFALFMLVWSILPSQMGLVFMAPAIAALFVVLVAHEIGHCIACRAVGGVADRVVLLPIGGLALTMPPDSWRAHLLTAAGGPAVNLLLAPVLVGGLLALGLGDHVLFHPLTPILTLASPSFQASTSALAMLKVTIWWLHYMNVLLFALNVLVPAYPLDGGRMLQAALWAKIGYRQAAETAVAVGYFSAAVLGALALVGNVSLLLAVAVFAAWSCWMERRRIRGEIELGALGYGSAGDADDLVNDSSSAAAPPDDREQREQAEVDRILAKIGASGMGSLTRHERKTLDAASRKRRGG